MPYRLASGILETTATTGDGTDLVLGGAQSGYRSASGNIADGAESTWAVWDDTQFEVFDAPYNSGLNTVERITNGTMIESSNANDPVNWTGAGPRNIGVVVPGSKLESFLDRLNQGVGLLVRTGSYTYTNKTISSGGSPLSVTNGDGQSGGNIIISSTAVPASGGVFTGAVTNVVSHTFVGLFTIFASAGHDFRKSVDTSDRILDWPNTGTNDHRLRNYVGGGGTPFDVLNSNDIPYSGLTEGDILSAKASGTGWETITAGVWREVTDQDFTAQSNIVVDLAPSGVSFRQYYVICDRIVPATAGADLWLTISDDDEVSYIGEGGGESAYDYIVDGKHNNAGAFDNRGNAQTQFLLNATPLDNATGEFNFYSCFFVINSLGSANEPFHYSGHFCQREADASNRFSSGYLGGATENDDQAAAATHMKFRMSNASNFDGRIQVWGIL